MKREIILIGGGGHCRSVIDVIEQEGKYQIAGIIEKNGFKDKNIFGYDIIGFNEDLECLAKSYSYAFVTVGQIKSNKARIHIFNLLKKIGYQLPVIVSPMSYVSRHAILEEGTIIMHHAMVNAGAKIGANTIVNSKALVEHDAIIGSHCHISTSSVINGGVIVENHSFIGSNATTKEYIVSEKFVRAGSVCLGDPEKNNMREMP